jgi:hypothetical protein
LLKELDLRPYIRRFRNVSGCTLKPDDRPLVTVDFGDLREKLVRLTALVAGECDRFAIRNDDSIAWNFVSLADELVKVGYKEKIRDSSDTSGACIFNRLFAASSEKKRMIVPVEEPEPIPEDEGEDEVLSRIADE